ncbi:MAG: type II toxin-antitoxin system HicA family toxin [Verrucomicrobiae bacterium]|nr:type II toxin-antitoxin system HicA family toxin [Verrucomicrobiae bacterium]
MSRYEKLLDKLFDAARDQTWEFSDLCVLLRRLGFQERNSGGSHVVFKHPMVIERITLQPNHGKAKPYQIRQIREILNHHPEIRL